MKVTCVMPYLTMVLNKEYEVIEEVNFGGKECLRLKDDTPHRNVVLVQLYDDFGNKFFKTQGEIREGLIKCILE